MPTVLVADDQHTIRLTLRRLLTLTFGCQVVEAADGVSALEVLAKGDIDLVTLDVGMPLVNGLEVLQAMRGSPDLAGVPVLVFSGSTDEETAREAIRLGANDYLVKPIRLELIRPRIQNLLDMSARKPSAVAKPTHDGPVLIVDPDPEFRALAKHALDATHHVSEAASGVDALALCRTLRPAAVIMSGEIGLVGPALLAKKLREQGCEGSALAFVLDEGEPPPDIAGIDGTLVRSLSGEAFRAEFKRIFDMRHGLPADLPEFIALRQAVEPAAQKALGAYSRTFVHVAALTVTNDVAPDDVRAVLAMELLGGTVAIDLEVRCALKTARMTAARQRAVDEGAVSDEDARHVVGEIATNLATRLQQVAKSQRGTAMVSPVALCVAETTGEATTPAHMALQLTSADGDLTYALFLTSRPVKRHEARRSA